MPPKKRAIDGEAVPAAKPKTKKPRAKKNKDVDDSGSDDDFGHGGDGNGVQAVEETFSGEIDDSMLPKEAGLVGRLIVCGGTNWDLIGRKELPKGSKDTPATPALSRNLWSPHRTDYRVKFIASSCTACHSFLITEDGKVMVWGRNDRGQLGTGDDKRRDLPTEVPVLTGLNVIAGAVGKMHTLFLTSKGAVYACGDNKNGQLGLNNQAQMILTPTKIHYSGKPIVKTACGAEFSMIVDCDGRLYSFGLPQYGQLGHNTDGQYFATSNRLAYRCELAPRRVVGFIEKTREGHVVPVDGVFITDVACGQNHSVALDKKNRVFTWGFGGYGRLGHTEAKNEMVPRLVKTFDIAGRGAKLVFAGGAFSMAVDVHDLLYFWGQTKSTGEATMYPKNVQDLNGWAVRSVGCSNRSIVLAADESTVSWGPSPTYGELGYGELKKSGTTPAEVKALDGIHIHQVSTGFGHTLYIAREESDEEKKLVEALPVWP